MNRSLLLTAAIIGLVYRPWFQLNKNLSGGDWPYLFGETAVAMPLMPGKGYLWLDTYFHSAAKFGMEFLGLSWEVTEKLFWFYPFLLIMFFSSWYFLNEIFVSERPSVRQLLSGIGSIVYSTNTYILMIAGGGQMGVAMGYALAPAVIGLFRKKNFIPAVGVSALQLMFDPRLFVITIFGYICIMSVESFVSRSRNVKHGLIFLVFVFVMAVIMNGFWIVPNVLDYRGMYEGATQGDSLSYFSFATFGNSISLLHPNWPENIFGKVGFMRPEFLLLPVIAFSSLIILKKEKLNSALVSFALVGLIGAFLSKGVQEPFGGIYRWLAKIPGFMIFRDPTKFYLLTALSYTVLISQGLLRVFRRILPLAIVVFLLFWFGLSLPAFRGELAGTFRPKNVPVDYLTLRNWLVSEHETARILWIPRHQRFGYTAWGQKVLNSQDEIADVSPQEFVQLLDTSEGKRMITEKQIRIFVVPYDSEQEIFISDRKYDDEKRKEWLTALDALDWIQKVPIAGITDSIAVYNVIY